MLYKVEPAQSDKTYVDPKYAIIVTAAFVVTLAVIANISTISDKVTAFISGQNHTAVDLNILQNE